MDGVCGVPRDDALTFVASAKGHEVCPQSLGNNDDTSL